MACNESNMITGKTGILNLGSFQLLCMGKLLTYLYQWKRSHMQFYAMASAHASLDYHWEKYTLIVLFWSISKSQRQLQIKLHVDFWTLHQHKVQFTIPDLLLADFVCVCMYEEASSQYCIFFVLGPWISPSGNRSELSWCKATYSTKAISSSLDQLRQASFLVLSRDFVSGDNFNNLLDFVTKDLATWRHRRLSY